MELDCGRLNQKERSVVVLVEKIEQIANINKVEKLDSKDLRKIKLLLLMNHTPENPDILKQFKLAPNEILTGVKCPTQDKDLAEKNPHLINNSKTKKFFSP